MGLLSRLFGSSEPKSPHPPAGTPYIGPAAFWSEPGRVPWPGFYALTPDGKDLLQPPLRLTAVNHVPDDPTHTGWHLQVSAPDDPPQMNAPTVLLEAHANGTSGTTATPEVLQ